MPFMQPHIAIDLGTVSVLVHSQGRGVVLQEPSVVAILDQDGRTVIVEVGRAAREMYGRTPEEIEVMRPLQNGVIADYFVTEGMLRYFLDKVTGRFSFRRPIVMITVPYGVTSVERRAVREAALTAGAREVHLIAEPLAAAIGAGLPVGTPTGNMVVDLGGGSTEAAVVAMNGIVCAESVRVGGIHLDEAIISYIRKRYNLIIGEPTAEEIKIKIGAAIEPEERLEMQVQGRDQISGLPKTITVSSTEVVEAISESLTAIATVVRTVLSKTPPELASDIIDRGMALTGGGALLRDIDTYITRATGVPAYIADNPIACTALGAGKALDELPILQRSLSF
ncbi:MAG: rod shape-determining protein [Anaerolineales bacterium]|nr:rod shape-determining protein [Anaerolineales bacterium]MCB0007836.1 rod shape-determining protein [Anaerolineales bacterium]MCB0013131.1 rod shape-determining protein [Anaerolineales bacterium]MCB0016481.1 rod shape-determining protein [Anaerolineales bacterium]